MIGCLSQQLKDTVSQMKEDQKLMAELLLRNDELQQNKKDESMVVGEPRQHQAPGASSDKNYYSDEDEFTVVENSRGKKRKKSSQDMKINSNNARKEQPKVPLVDPKPPPIYLKNVKDNYKVIEAAVQEQAPQSKVTVLRDDQVKVNTANSDGFRHLSEFLRNEGCEFYTYQDKQTRPYSVMVKGIHKSLPESEIQTRFQAEYPALGQVQVTRKLQRMTKNPLDMCIVTFKNGTNIDDIHKITSLQGVKISVESIKASKLVAQCKKCQGFGHTKNYCGLEAKCVKCSKKHRTEECTKPREVHPRCANCNSGEHPASYRGCPVAIEAQKIHQKNIHQQPAVGSKKKFIPKTPSVVLAKAKQETWTPGAGQENLQVYAQVLKNTQAVQQQPPLNQSQVDPLKMILERLNQIDQRFIEVNRRLGALENKNSKASHKK